jgi:hypothetical protein
MDRYPEIFSACRDYFVGKPNPRILSYGCATGEEVLTLRGYFASSLIVGAEINRHSLSVARRNNVDKCAVFVESDPTTIRDMGPYDAIFCMAVLQKEPLLVIEKEPTNLKDFYPFQKFEAKVVELDSWLNKDGLLVIHNSQYAFTDVPVAWNYFPLPAAKDIFRWGPLFDRNSERLDPRSRIEPVFVKMRD